EFLPPGAFGLDPVLAATRAIGGIAILGYDAFEAQPAGMAENEFAVLLEMVAEAQDRRGTLKECLQGSLAADQRRRTQIIAIGVEEIEGIEDHPVGSAVGKIRLQRRKIRRAARAFHDHLAVDNGLLHRKTGERPDDRRAEFGSPVEAAPRQEMDLASAQMSLQPIAV